MRILLGVALGWYIWAVLDIVRTSFWRWTLKQLLMVVAWITGLLLLLFAPTGGWF